MPSRAEKSSVRRGLAAVVVIGGIGGGYLGPREGKLAKLAARDVAKTDPDAEVSWSAEYESRKQVGTDRRIDVAAHHRVAVFFVALDLGA
jgi:hypothetical protein